MGGAKGHGWKGEEGSRIGAESSRRPIGAVDRGYSLLVGAMKRVLPVLALGLLGLLAAWPSLNEAPHPKIGIDQGQLEMIRPRYFSSDAKNQPYSMSAARAEQAADRQNLIILDAPQAEMTEVEGAWVNIRGQHGWYDQDSGILKLRGDVHVLRDDGGEFTTEEAFVDVRAGTAWGDVHVESQGPQGVVLADGFRLSDRGRTVVFLNSSNAQVRSAETSGRKK